MQTSLWLVHELQHTIMLTCKYLTHCFHNSELSESGGFFVVWSRIWHEDTEVFCWTWTFQSRSLHLLLCWERDAAPVVTDSRSFHFSFTLNSTLLLLDLAHLIFLNAFINMTPGYWLGVTVLSQNYAASHKCFLCQINCFNTEISSLKIVLIISYLQYIVGLS